MVTAGQRRLDQPGLQAHVSLDTYFRRGCCGRACGPRAGSGGHTGLPGGPLPTRSGETTSRKLSVTDALLQLESRERWRHPLLPGTCKGGCTWCPVRTAGTCPGGSCWGPRYSWPHLHRSRELLGPCVPRAASAVAPLDERLSACFLRNGVLCPCLLLSHAVLFSLLSGTWQHVTPPTSAGQPFNALGAEILFSMPLSKPLFQIIVKFSL